MAFAIHRGLAIPLWATAFFAVALTAPPTATLFLMPPTTVLAIAAVGIAAIVFLMPRPIPWFPTSRALVRVPSGHRRQTSATVARAVGPGVRTLDEPNRRTADDTLALLRMDDDGGSQPARPSA